MVANPVLTKASLKPVTASSQQTWKRVLDKILNDRVAFISLLILSILYLTVAFADFIGPYSQSWSNRSVANAPPTPIYMIDDESGGLSWPYVYTYQQQLDPNDFTLSYVPNTDHKYYLSFFTPGEAYQFLGLIPGNLHLFGVKAPARVALLGNDMNGRDNFSRLLFGGQVSLTIGFLSLFIAFPVGLLYGGISGFFGGKLDNMMQRFAEVIMSIPSLYLLISLAAILPPGMSSTSRFAMVTIILALIGWAGLSRVIRGMVLSLKNQEFIEAEKALGLGPMGIIIKHILPQTASFIIIAITVSVPSYILAESGLSFLGLGIQQPDASWGNMLKEAQEITNIITRPWMLTPGLLIFIAVLAFNVIGDAIRDVLDPKSHFKK